MLENFEPLLKLLWQVWEITQLQNTEIGHKLDGKKIEKMCKFLKIIFSYIMIIYHLEDGTCIHTSVISMPETVFTQLQFGYVITP